MPVPAKTLSGASHLEKNFAGKFHQLWEIWQVKTAQFFVAHPVLYFEFKCYRAYHLKENLKLDPNCRAIAN